MTSSKNAVDFVWEQIDHKLVGLKLMEISDDMLRVQQDDLARIQHENRLNSNTYSELHQRLDATLKRLDERAERSYQAYCDTWATQGKRKSSTFVHCVYSRAIMQLFVVQVSALKSGLASENIRTNRWENNVLTAVFTSLDREVERLKERWARKLEIEAIGCEYSESTSELEGVQESELPRHIAQEKVEKTASSRMKPTNKTPSYENKERTDIVKLRPAWVFP